MSAGAALWRIRVAGLLVAAAFILGACSHGDQGQIDALVRGYIDAFAHQDVQRWPPTSRRHAT